MGTRRRFARALPALAAVAAALLLVGPALAAEFGEGEIYRLEAGQVVEDDLIVAADEIYIDGTVQGDLIAVASYVEINGLVEGDLMAAGADVRIPGQVADDVRVAGAGVAVSGDIGDDLFAVAGGGEGVPDISQMAGRPVRQGLYVEPGATIGGSAYLGGGAVTMAGAVDEDLGVGAGYATLAGTVGGDATVKVTRLNVERGAKVEGTLTYTAQGEAAVPRGTADDVRFEPPPPEPQQTAAARQDALIGKVTRTGLALLGFALAGWLLLRFAPASLRRPAEALAARPGQAALYGIAALAVIFAVPVLSGLVFLSVLLFWGWFPAVMFALLLTAALVLGWVLSPLVTGLWLGRLVWPAKDRGYSDLAALVAGVALVVLTGLLPWVGWAIGLASLTLAVGGLIAAARGTYDAPAPTVTAAPIPA